MQTLEELQITLVQEGNNYSIPEGTEGQHIASFYVI